MNLPLAHHRLRPVGFAALLAVGALAAPAPAVPLPSIQETGSEQTSGADRVVGPLVVGTKEAAPFSFRGPDGEWTGVSIDLWRLVAADLGIDYEFREASLSDLVQGLPDGRFDASVAALTITPERELILDFVHAFYPSGLGIAVSAEESGGALGILSNIFTLQFLKAVGTLVLVLFLGGAVLWLLERRKNPEQFGGKPAEALGSAFWWSATTMTTVGYGDKAPITGLGRLVGVIWMFAGVITISGLTATIASTLTVSRLEHAVSGPEDLPDMGRIACVSSSTSEEYMKEERLAYDAFPTAREAMQALADGKVKAVVYDQPILSYLALNNFDDQIRVLPVTFEKQDYAFALPLESPLRKDINRSLISILSSGDDWDDILFKYLGSAQ